MKFLRNFADLMTNNTFFDYFWLILIFVKENDVFAKSNVYRALMMVKSYFSLGKYNFYFSR